MDDVAIRLENVSKIYKLYNSSGDRFKEALNPFGKIYHKDFYALNDIDLEIKKGEILGIVGKNGCGKSTLLKLISGVLTPSDGGVQVNGKITALLELGSGFNPEFTGHQNIFFYGTILGFSKKEMDGKLEEIKAFADLGDFIDQPLKTYSSGMKARLGFSLAVSVNPDILIIDEVLSVGDLVFKRKCYNKIQELFSDGKTVILVSHNSQVITQHCSRAIMLRDGSIACDGRPKNVLNYYEREIFSVSNNTNGPIQKPPINEVKQNNKYSDSNSCGSVQTNKNLANIYDIKIININQKVVDLLDRNDKYTIEFKVKYKEGIDKVSLGARIKDMTGFVISGANIYDFQQQLISRVDGGDVLKVCWDFKCLLVPGSYSVTVFSFSTSTKDVIELDDAVLFKVLPDNNINYGVVGLEQKIHIERLNSDDELQVEHCGNKN